MENKSIELWEKTYGKEEYSFDFANKLIIKNQYKTESPFAWDTELYNQNEEKMFIANLETIKIRDSQSMFEIDSNKYIITKNPDYSYSILSTSKISDENCPINFDLFLNNKINTYQEKEYSFIIISVKKMQPDILNVFGNYLVEYLKIFKELVSFDISNENFSRTELKFQFLLSDTFTIKKTLEVGMTISSLMPLIVHRLSALSPQLWSSESESWEYFNIFISSAKTDENIFHLKNMEILGMLVSFENFIFVDEDVKEKLIKEGIFNNNFSKAKNSGTEGVYKYKFSRNDIFQYNELVFSKKN